MKIHGVEGLSPETLRDEVNRGGRFVIYTYCVSVLVMTFKRPTGIYYIKPGSSPVVAGLPFVGVSFLFGWWGFPWGPIYSIETIYKNLCGGIDVTGDIVRELAPGTGPVVPPPVVATPAPASFHQTQSTTDTQPVSHAHPAAPRSGFNFRVAAMMVLAVCLAVVIGISGYCYYQQTHMQVVLVSGLDTPYSIKLNGEEHTLPPHAVRVLTMSEGDFTIEDAGGTSVVGSPRTTTLSIPFLDHLGTEKLAIINPDELAVLLDVDVHYYSDSASARMDEGSRYDVLANKWSRVIDKPDYVLDPAPQQIEMPSGTGRVVKRRLQNLPQAEISVVLDQLQSQDGYPATRDYIMRAAKWRSDEKFLTSCVPLLEKEDQPAFFALHLTDRPVAIEWHRFYQQRMTVFEPEHDLAAEYRALLDAEPENGTLAYLLGRVVPGHAEQDKLWSRALSGDSPCYYAYNALGYDAFTVCRFDDALSYFEKAKDSGVPNSSLTLYRRQALMAAGRIDDALKEIAAEQKARPLDVMLTIEQIEFVFASNHDFNTASRTRDEFIRAYKKIGPPPDYLENIELLLGATIACLADDQEASGRMLSKSKTPFYQLRGALLTGDLQTALKLTSEKFSNDASSHFLTLILADRKGDRATAETQFAEARSALAHGNPDERIVSAELAKDSPDAAVICDAHVDPASKRILLTALGTRFPADRETYFAMARRLNFSPAFPQRFLNESLQQPAATTRL